MPALSIVVDIASKWARAPREMYELYEVLREPDATDASHAARLIVAALEQQYDPEARWCLLAGLALLVSRMEPGEALRICGPALSQLADSIPYKPQVAWIFIDALKLSRLPELTAALKNETDPRVRANLADALGGLAAHTSGAAAAAAADALSAALAADKSDRLAQALARFASRIEKADATRVCSRAANELANALENEEDALPARTIGWGIYTNDTRDYRPRLALAILSLTAYMAGAEADQLCREVIRALLKRLNAPDDSMVLLLPRLDPKTARGLAREFALRLCSENDPAGSGLNAILTDHGQTSPDPHLIGTPQPSNESLPCRLATQELVDLLKMPTCFGEARRVILHHLGNRYGRRFVNHWAFIRFAREQNLGLDFTTPPKRPDPGESVRRMLEILDEPAAGN
jgi:hypothetical protein